MINDEIKGDSTLKNTATKLNKSGLESLEEYNSGKTRQNDW